MAGFGLINMNGRVYDPYLQRFLSPDPIVQEPGNAQNFNRYSYVLNNPLMYIDPTGYSTLDYQEGIANMSFSLPGSGIDHGWGYSTQPTTGNTFGRWSLYSHNWQNPYSGLNNSYHYNNGTYYNGNGEVVPFSRVHNYIDYKLGLGKWVTFNRWSEKGKGGFYLGELTSMAVWVLRGRGPMSADENITSNQQDNFLNSIWNSRIARKIVPDAVYINISGVLCFVGGGGVDIGIALPLRGSDAGKLNIFTTFKGKMGYHFGVSVNIGSSSYVGSIELFDFSDTFGGLSSGVEADFAAGMSFSSSKPDRFGNSLFSYDIGYGPGVGGSINISSFTYNGLIINLW